MKAQRRFYANAAAAPAPDGYTVTLDGKSLRTPLGAAFTVPTRALAEAIAAEWQAQGDMVLPRTMPLAGIANAAIDRVIPAREKIRAAALAYGASDLVCYRAPDRGELRARQDAAWDPLLAWLKERHGVALSVGEGVVHIEQPREALDAFADAVAALDGYRLAALWAAAGLLGSLVLALALTDGRLDAETAWRASQIDEIYQAEHWGVDAEATARRAAQQSDLEAAGRFLRLLDIPD